VRTLFVVGGIGVDGGYLVLFIRRWIQVFSSSTQHIVSPETVTVLLSAFVRVDRSARWCVGRVVGWMTIHKVDTASDLFIISSFLFFITINKVQR
jgi:hypothetical protein